METLNALSINQKLDLLVTKKVEHHKFKTECKEIKLVKIFDYLIGKQEPFFRQIQLNRLYKITKINCSIKAFLETIIKSNDNYLMPSKIIAKEIIEDQEKVNKLKFIVS